MGYGEQNLAALHMSLTSREVDSARIVAAAVVVRTVEGAVSDSWAWPAETGGEVPIGELTQTLRVLDALGLPLVVHNAPVLLSVLERECLRARIEPPHPSVVVDVAVLDRHADPERSGKRKPPGLADLHGIPLADPDRPADVAAAMAGVAASLAQQVPDYRIDARDLQAAQAEWYAEQVDAYQTKRRAAGADYTATSDWPTVPVRSAISIEDTQPIPAPPLRPSETVPTFDFGDTSPRELDAPAAIEPDPAGPIHVAAAIVTDAEGRTLLVRKRGSDAFMQAGGKIEAAESALGALVRELDEELGLAVDPSATEFLGTYSAPALNEPGATVQAEVFALSTEGPLSPASEIAEILWVDAAAVDELPLAPLTRDVLVPLWASRRPVAPGAVAE